MKCGRLHIIPVAYMLITWKRVEVRLYPVILSVFRCKHTHTHTHSLTGSSVYRQIYNPISLAILWPFGASSLTLNSFVLKLILTMHFQVSGEDVSQQTLTLRQIFGSIFN